MAHRCIQYEGRETRAGLWNDVLIAQPLQSPRLLSAYCLSIFSAPGLSLTYTSKTKLQYMKLVELRRLFHVSGEGREKMSDVQVCWIRTE